MKWQIVWIVFWASVLLLMAGIIPQPHWAKSVSVLLLLAGLSLYQMYGDETRQKTAVTREAKAKEDFTKIVAELDEIMLANLMASRDGDADFVISKYDHTVIAGYKSGAIRYVAMRGLYGVRVFKQHGPPYKVSNEDIDWYWLKEIYHSRS